MSAGSRKRKAPKGCYWRGNTLWAYVYVAGKEHRKSLDTDEPKLATQRREALEKRLKAFKHGDARLTYGEVFTGWLDWIPAQVGPGTVKAYANALDQIAPFLDGKHLDEINDDLIVGIIKARRKQGVTNATIKRGLVALSSVFNYAFDEGLWKHGNPVLARLKRLKERRDPIVLPRGEDVAKVFTRASKASEMFGLMILAARATGCRLEELASATHGNLDLPARRLTVIGKRRKLRVIDLEPFGGVAILEKLPPGVASAPLFWHGTALRFDNISSRFAGFTRDISIADPDFVRFRFHDLRHLHAVEWLRSGRSIYDLQKRLGHSSIRTTEVYLDYLTPEEVARCKGQTAVPAQKSEQQDEAPPAKAIE